MQNYFLRHFSLINLAGFDRKWSQVFINPSGSDYWIRCLIRVQRVYILVSIFIWNNLESPLWHLEFIVLHTGGSCINRITNIIKTKNNERILRAHNITFFRFRFHKWSVIPCLYWLIIRVLQQICLGRLKGITNEIVLLVLWCTDCFRTLRPNLS